MSETASTEQAVPRHATERLRAEPDDVSRAAALLASGRLVAFPTETVYGLGADGRDAHAVAALYAAKGRPRFNPLIAHLADLDAARLEGTFGDAAERLAQAFWPGPLTLVVPAAGSGCVCELARAGLSTIGLRIPSHPVARELLRRCGFPVVAPSANRSGHVSPTAAAHVAADLDGRIDAILDGGDAPLGLESTIVACLDEEPRLLRPGAIAREALEAVLGRRLAASEGKSARPLAPGALSSHYAPRAKVRLKAAEVRPGEAAILFGNEGIAGLSGAVFVRNLSCRGDVVEAAARLYAALREADASGAASIAVAPIPDAGLGEAINDRLRRAAAER